MKVFQLKEEITVDAILAAYRDRLVRKQVVPGTLLATDKAHRRFQAYLDGLGLTAATIPPLLVEEYFSGLCQTLAISTVKQNLIQIHAAYRYAQKLGMIQRLPTIDVVLPRVPDKEPVTFSADQLRRIWAACRDQRDEILFVGLAYTGLRDHELRQLKWSDVDLANQQMHVLGKGGKFRLVPIHPVWAEILIVAERRNDYVLTSVRDFGNRSVTYRHTQERLQRILKRAGIKGSAHVFRRTVATFLDEAEVRESVIDSIMGWAPRTVRRRHYTRIRPERVYAGILELYRSDPVVTQRPLIRAV
jgi:integrase